LDNGVLTVTLDRADRLNALTFEIYQELGEFFAALKDEDDVKAVVLTGAGRGFCSGGDVEDIIGELFSRDADGLHQFTCMTCDVVKNMISLEKPVIGAINGIAAGAGAVLATACDIRIVAENAKFAYLFPQVGLSGADMGMCYLLPRIIGFGRAMQVLYTGEKITSDRLLAWGLANEVVAQEEVVARAQDFALQLARGPVTAHGVTKRMLYREMYMPVMEALDAEGEIQAELMLHPDFREAYDAWVEKRAPKFQGAVD
jgi:enoyl-CoA hydratase/carnithine racemase